MKRIVFCVIPLFIASFMMAQGYRGSGYWRANGRTEINPTTLMMYEGTITAVDIFRGKGHPNITVATENGELNFTLGPVWLLEEKGLVLEKGDRVTIRAFMCYRTGKTEYVSKEITNDTKGVSAVFRDDNGNPLWQGPRQKGQGRGQGRGGKRFGGNYSNPSQ